MRPLATSGRVVFWQRLPSLLHAAEGHSHPQHIKAIGPGGRVRQLNDEEHQQVVAYLESIRGETSCCWYAVVDDMGDTLYTGCLGSEAERIASNPYSDCYLGSGRTGSEARQSAMEQLARGQIYEG